MQTEKNEESRRKRSKGKTRTVGGQTTQLLFVCCTKSTNDFCRFRLGLWRREFPGWRGHAMQYIAYHRTHWGRKDCGSLCLRSGTGLQGTIPNSQLCCKSHRNALTGPPASPGVWGQRFISAQWPSDSFPAERGHSVTSGGQSGCKRTQTLLL